MKLFQENFPKGYKKIRFPETSRIGIKPVSKEGTERLVRAALDYAIAQKKPNTIIYISCNPVTQVKDLLQLSKSYRVEKRFGVDLFPQTIHVESVVILKRN